MIHHTKLKQAMDLGCYMSQADGRVRIFWPQRAVELFTTTPDEALIEMKAVQNILHNFVDYKVSTNNGCQVTLYNQLSDMQMVGTPHLPTAIWATLEAGEDEWAPGNGKLVERLDETHINGVAKSGAVAYSEGTPASDCPFLEESDDFSRWNAEWDEAADKAMENEPKSNGIGSVVTSRYRAKYTELGHPTNCGDDLATLLNNICVNKAGTNIELFEAICSANGVSLAKYNRTSKGWQGRLRMTGRNLLAKKVVAQGGKLLMPDGVQPEYYQLTQQWVVVTESKYKPKGN